MLIVIGLVCIVAGAFWNNEMIAAVGSLAIAVGIVKWMYSTRRGN